MEQDNKLIILLTYFAILVVSAMTTFLFTPVVRRLAITWGAVDLPSERKVHAQPMPRLGGLAVFAGFCYPWVGLYLFNNNPVTFEVQNYEKLFLALMVSAFCMLLLGIYDDIKGADAKQKFMIQILVAVGLYFAGYKITYISNPLGTNIELPWIISFGVTCLWIVGITNALNLLDGIDGLATGVTACIALSLAIFNIVVMKNISITVLTLCLAGGCIGFLPHNFSPAKIFLGDAGSLFMGVVLACIGILSFFSVNQANVVFQAWPLWLFILFGLPLFDMTSVMIGRLWRGVPIFQADKTHLHHRLLNRGWNHRRASCFLYAITVCLCSIAIFLSLPEPVMIQAKLIFSGVVLVTLGGLSYWLWHH